MRSTGLNSALAVAAFPAPCTDDGPLRLNMEEELRHETRVPAVSARVIMGVEPEQAVNVEAYESLAVMWDATIRSGTRLSRLCSDDGEAAALVVLALALASIAFFFGRSSKDRPTAATCAFG